MVWWTRKVVVLDWDLEGDQEALYCRRGEGAWLGVKSASSRDRGH